MKPPTFLDWEQARSKSIESCVDRSLPAYTVLTNFIAAEFMQ
jgi:hypothetical protein